MNFQVKSYYGIEIFLFTAPISVCTILCGNLDSVILFCSILLSMGFINWLSYRPSKQLKWILTLFYLPILISFCWSCFLIPLINNKYYYSFVRSDQILRAFHVLLYLAMLLYADVVIRHSHNKLLQKYLMIFAYGVIVILGIFGIWQILGQFFGIWVPEIQTRSSMYFARGLGFGRVTSLADEPSYLAPFLIDAILIFIFLRHNIEAILLSIVLLFSFSFGGLMESIILISYYFYIASKNTKIKIITVALTVVVIILIIFPQIIEIITTLISSRAELQSGFDPSETSRTAMLILPIKKWASFDIISLLLGYGPGSSKYLFYSNPNEALFSTSNNIYVDLLYEEGLVGVGCYLLLLYKFWKFFDFADVRQRIVSHLIIIHVAISSLYRADYASGRYTVLFIVFIIFSHLRIKNESLRISTNF